jgi:hypothetical protein
LEYRANTGLGYRVTYAGSNASSANPNDMHMRGSLKVRRSLRIPSYDPGFWVKGLKDMGYRVYGTGYSVYGIGYRIQG